MFGKKKQTSPVSYIDDTRVIVHDFRRRLPFESYRPTDYLLPTAFESGEMLPYLDGKLDAAGFLDEGNADALDNTILAAAKDAFCALRLQYIGKTDLLTRLFARRAADRADLEARMRQVEARREDELRQLEAYKELERRLGA